MTILRIQNTVHDYDAWKAAFDNYAAVRERMGVRSYRVTRRIDDDQEVFVELDFDTRGEAEDFLVFLTEKVWRTPRSQGLLAAHHEPRLLDLVEAATTGAPA